VFALIYLILAIAAGHCVRVRLLPGLDGSALPPERRFAGRWVIALPAAFLIGTLLITWAVYLVAWLTRRADAPLAIANPGVLGVVAFAMTAMIVRRRGRGQADVRSPRLLMEQRRPHPLDVAVLVTSLAIGTAIMFHTCRLDGNTLLLGRTAFDDLNVHLGMARSFSFGKNFPTGYVAFAGNDIRYHFMFFFLVGNLEYLGLPLDWALNLPSILSFSCVLLLLYALGNTIGRGRWVGALSVVFFLLRSSPAALVYLAQSHAANIPRAIRSLVQGKSYIGLTKYESWGIWNLDTYVGERHFAFSFALVLLAVLYLTRATGIDDSVPLMTRFKVAARTPASIRD